MRRRGMPRSGLSDLYHNLITMKWRWLLLLVVGWYGALNCAFALLYMVQPGSVEHAAEDSFSDHFFFSVQTMATIGYGKMVPRTDLANALVAVEALIGMLGVACATGIIFSKFSRPAARVMFSEHAVIAPRDGVLCLMFRVGNERSTQIVEASMTVALLMDELTGEGERLRKFHELVLQTSRTPVFALSWTAIHSVDPSSPLHGLTHQRMVEGHHELIVSLVGIEETTGQQVHARHVYTVGSILWNRRLAEMYSLDESGERVMDFTRFHSTVPIRRTRITQGEKNV